MKNQEIFDTIATHLFTQGHRSYDERVRSCMYRASDGSKCAVGCLIPDEKYQSHIEGSTAASLDPNRFDFKPSKANYDLMGRLQCIHDISYNWESTNNMKEALKRVAKKHRLNFKVLNTLNFKDR